MGNRLSSLLRARRSRANDGSPKQIKEDNPGYDKPIFKDYPDSDKGTTSEKGNGVPNINPEVNAAGSVQRALSSPKTIVRALHNFSAINEGDLSFKKDDLLELEDGSALDRDAWVIATHMSKKKKGCIPGNYVIIHDDLSKSVKDWWFEVDHHEADRLLLLPGHKRGTFLIRGAKDGTSLALSVLTTDEEQQEPAVRHYRIKVTDNEEYYIGVNNMFKDLNSLVSFYSKKNAGLCEALGDVLPRIRPTIAFRDLDVKRGEVKMSSKLGQGCFGEVWKGKLRKVVDVAIKTLKAGSMSPDAFLEEAKVMHALRHPRLVQLMAIVLEEPFWIITELMPHGALLEFLRSPKGENLKYIQLINMNYQISEGMAFLESKNYVHRDLRAANILVGEQYTVKVADFGLARFLDEDVYEGSAQTKFPIKWTAPEAASHKRFTTKSDVWSFGVLMYEIITLGKVPYPGLRANEIIQMLECGHRLERPTRTHVPVPDYYYELMLKCWHKNPQDRPTFEALHSIFDDYATNAENSYK